MRFVFALAFASPLAAQGTVHVVDVNEGPGFDFTQIADAVAAASNGDTLLVRGGGYDPFTVDGKSLTIVEDAGLDARIAGTVTVRNLGASQRLVLRGLRTGTLGEEGILVEDCDGTVWIEECEFLGNFGADAYDGANFSYVARAAIVRSQLEGGLGSGSLSAFSGEPGGDGIETWRSDLFAWESAFVGGRGGDADDYAGSGGNGLLFRANGASTAFVVGTRLRGADGGRADDDFDFICGCEDCGNTGPGGDGIRAWADETSTLVVRDNIYNPGFGGETTSQNPDCTDGPDGVPISAFDTPVVEYAGEVPRFSASSPTREGGAIDLQSTGAPGDLVTLMIATEPFTVWLDPLLGAVGLLPPVTLFPFGVVPGDGVLAGSFPAPGLPSTLESAVLFAQPVHLGLDASVELSTPTALILLDGSL